MRRIVAIILALTPLAYPQDSKYAGRFLEFPVGAWAAGMGNAVVSVADDGTAFHYNPAGGALTPSYTLSAMYSSQYGALFGPLANFYFIGYAQKLQDISVAVDWVRLSVDDIPSRPDLTIYESPVQREMLVKSGAGSGSFTSADDAFYLNISRLFEFTADMGWAFSKLPVSLPVGLNFKVVQRSLIGRSASGVGIDGGFMIRFPAGTFFGEKKTGTFSFGLSLRDITNTRIAWDTQTTEVIPRSSVWGASYNVPLEPIRSSLLLAMNRETMYGDLLFGLEYVYHDLLSVRLGRDAANLSAGAGVRLDFMRVDYAFLAQDLGNVNRVSASFYIDKIVK